MCKNSVHMIEMMLYRRIGTVFYKLQKGKEWRTMEKEKYIPEEDFRTILRAADMIIPRGGRSLLTKILKGPREKKLLEL